MSTANDKNPNYQNGTKTEILQYNLCNLKLLYQFCVSNASQKVIKSKRLTLGAELKKRHVIKIAMKVKARCTYFVL